MVAVSSHEPEDRTAYGQRMYDLGYYNAYLEMSVKLAQGLAEIPQPQEQTPPPHARQVDNAEILALPIESLNIGNPAPRILKRQGILTIGELIQYSRADLVGFRGLGVCTASQIDMSLRRYDLTLRKV